MFLPAHDLIRSDAAKTRAWLLVLHGIYGRGRNWRSFARAVVERRPGWGVCTVDLRMHGASLDAPPPHTIEAAAADLHPLAARLGEDGAPVAAVLGHSFGGKVALAYRLAASDALRQTWIIDASPSPSPGAIDDPDNTPVRVLRLVRALPRTYPDRDAFVERIAAAGFDRGVAHWFAMNLERDPGGDTLSLTFDPDALEALLSDYYARDLWPAIDADGPGDLHLVVAGRSSAVSAEDRARAAASPACVHTIEDSGHWVHIDAPEALLDLVAADLPDV